MDQIAEKIVEHARTWKDTPFKHQGRERDGCDCVGVIVSICHMLDMKVQDYTSYKRLPDSDILLKKCREYGKEVPRNQYQPGDVLLMTWKKDKKRPHHFAIVTEMDEGVMGIIHSNSVIGKMVEHNLDKRWIKRITHVFRFPAIAVNGPKNG